MDRGTLRRPRLRRARSRVRKAPGRERQAHCRHRRHGPRQGAPEHRSARGSLVRELHARGDRDALEGAPRRSAGDAPLRNVGGPMKLYEETLLELALADERIVVMTAENRAAIRSLPAKLGARFVDVGIAEQTMIGAAAGLALRGRIPVVHALATFLTLRAFEFVRTDVGIARLPVKLVGGVPGFLSDGNGPTHQAIEDIALMRGIPGMEVVCPTDEEELVAAVPLVVARPGPCYVRFVGGPARVR